MRQTFAAVKMLVVLTLLVGVGYPLAVWGAGQAVFHSQANGSFVTRDGDVVASSLIGQDVTGDDWFHPRPSAVGYDPLGSGASNLGPESNELVEQIEGRREAVASLEGVDPASVPPDALTASASGLDPFISPEYAALQVPRVAEARGLTEGQVGALVEAATSGRSWGFLGQPRVNVVELNLVLFDLTTG